MNPSYYLKGFNNLNQFSHSINLEKNICVFFDFACLLSSGYQNFVNGTSYLGSNLGTLKCSTSRQYASGRVWEGFRSNWVWESGSGINPVNISGVYINGVFTTSGFNVDYRRGQIVLDTAISTSSTVQASFSSKSIYWDTTASPWYREFITETYRYDKQLTDGIGSGIRNVLADHRIQLPAVIVEVTTTNNFEPYQLGGGSWYKPMINFHVFAENFDQKKQIVDIISAQNEHSFLGVDFNKVYQARDFPTNQFNFVNSGAKLLPQMQALYPWEVKPISFEDLQGRDLEYTPPLYRSLVYGKANLILPYI